MLYAPPIVKRSGLTQRLRSHAVIALCDAHTKQLAILQVAKKKKKKLNLLSDELRCDTRLMYSHLTICRKPSV